MTPDEHGAELDIQCHVPDCRCSQVEIYVNPMIILEGWHRWDSLRRETLRVQEELLSLAHTFEPQVGKIGSLANCITPTARRLAQLLAEAEKGCR